MIEFTKMHGIGNDFIVVDALSESWSQPRASAASIELNDRRLGVGGDGLILVERGEQAPFRMRMFNPDGSESEMCGNGVRCVAKFVRDRGHTQEASMPIETGAGVLELQVLQDSRVRVNMGIARLDRSEIPVAAEGEGPFVEQPLALRKVTLCATCVSLGNPHAVVFVPDAASVPIGEWGPEIETHPLFPARINAHFVQVLSRSELVQRTWERGAGICQFGQAHDLLP